MNLSRISICAYIDTYEGSSIMLKTLNVDKKESRFSRTLLDGDDLSFYVILHKGTKKLCESGVIALK